MLNAERCAAGSVAGVAYRRTMDLSPESADRSSERVARLLELMDRDPQQVPAEIERMTADEARETVLGLVSYLHAHAKRVGSAPLN